MGAATTIAKGRPRLTDQEIYQGFSPERWTWKTIDWPTLFWIGMMHIGCIAAPFYFTWEALGVGLVLYFFTGCFGVTLGYHRFLAHRSLKAVAPVKFFLMLCGCLSGQSTPMHWAANHRLHHARSDQPGDPHSPRDGKWWSHILWLFMERSSVENEALYQRFIPDLMRDPMMRFFEKTFLLWSFVIGGLLMYFGGLPMLLWGLCARMVFLYHSTWFVNSATHLWGYKSYAITDDSRNLWWVAALTFGEGWHNNHHAFPSLARAGHRWWEVDVTFMMIRLLRMFGLVWNVKDEIPQRGQEIESMESSDEPPTAITGHFVGDVTSTTSPVTVEL